MNKIISSTNKDEQSSSSYDEMSFEEKTKQLVVDDNEQWKNFQQTLKEEGALTDIAVKNALYEFVKERERIMRMQEEIKKNEKKEERKQHHHQQQQQRRNLRESLMQLGDSARSLKEQVIGSFQDESIALKQSSRNIVGSKAA